MRQKIEESGGEKKRTIGAGSLIFGSMLLFTALLDTMFSFKTGISGGIFNYIIFAGGAVLLLNGFLRGR